VEKKPEGGRGAENWERRIDEEGVQDDNGYTVGCSVDAQ
jgi:hypothetical protein